MVIGGEEGERRMGKGKEKLEEDGKTTSFVLFGCRIQIGDRETKERVRGSSSGSDSPIAYPIKDSQDRHSNFLPTTSSHASTSASTAILLPLFHNNEEKKKKRKFVEPESHPYGWEGVLRDIGAMELISISTKDLTMSDTDERQNRLLLPKRHVKENLLPLLTEEKKERLTHGGIPAIMVDAMGRQWETCFNCWKSKSRNLNGDWTKLVETIGLSSARHRVEVTTFRHGGEARHLGFVVLHQNKDVVLLDLFN